MKSDFVFFTANDFTQTDGGTIRMIGIIEALTIAGKTVTLISNIEDKSILPLSVSHVPIGRGLTKRKRQLLLSIVAIFPAVLAIPLVSLTFKEAFAAMRQAECERKRIIFFEYFDLAVGYVWSRKFGNKKHIFDVHGIATLEFSEKDSARVHEFVIARVKGLLVSLLDKKIYSWAGKVIVLNKVMGTYFTNRFKNLTQDQLLFVDDGITNSYLQTSVDEKLRERLLYENNLSKSSKILFFAGTFKQMGGVSDLIDAVVQILRLGQYDIELVLVGAGEEEPLLRAKALASGFEEKIHFLGRCAYSDLRSYQSLADIIICPDRQHEYSDMIVHTKYYEALMSEKVVINSGSPEVLRINNEHALSLTFEPSNIDDLAGKIIYALCNFLTESKKCQSSGEKVLQNFTYQKTVRGLIDSVEE